MTDPFQMKSLALAYMGDAVYEVYVREYLIERGEVKPQKLHQAAVRFVAAKAQAAVIRGWMEEGLLTETEEANQIPQKVQMSKRIDGAQHLRRWSVIYT